MRLSLFLTLCAAGLVLYAANEATHAKPTAGEAVSKPVPPQGIIGDSKAAIAEARAIMKAFREDGVTVKLTKPPVSDTTPRPDVGGLPRPRDAVCPAGGCVVAPTLPRKPAPQRASNGACGSGPSRPLLYRLTRGRRGG